LVWMADLVTIEIAGVNFRVSCRSPIGLMPCDPSYESFTKRGRQTGEVNVDVILETGPVPATDGMKKIFDAGRSWALFLDGAHYFLSLGHMHRDGPVWVARFRRDLREVIVYCSDVLIRKKDGLTTVLNPLSYPLDQILLVHALLPLKGFLVHAAGIEIAGGGYIFPGRSGAGKTTLSGLFMARGHKDILSDDRIAAKRMGSVFCAFGTPWPGEGRIASNRSAELRGIFFISQAASDKIEEIGPGTAAERLMPIVSIPWYDRELSEKALALCEDLVAKVPSYVLHFRPGTGIVDLLEDFTAGRARE
jgi:hypothetical protein